MDNTRSEIADLTSSHENRQALTQAFQELLSEFPINAIESAFRAVRREGALFASGAELLEAACKRLRSRPDAPRISGSTSRSSTG